MTAVLDVEKWGVSGKITQALTPDSTTMRVSSADIVRVRPKEGTHYYLTLRSCGRYEVVKVTCVTSDSLCITRGIDKTTPEHWPVGTCFQFEWNPSQLCEYVANCGHPTSTGLTGVVCTDCSSCLTLENGVVIKVDGGKPCSNP